GVSDTGCQTRGVRPSPCGESRIIGRERQDLMRRAAWCAVSLVAVTAAPSVASAASPTFTKDVAPILYNSCVGCHRAGEVAPMSLVSYDEVRPWARSIRLKVTSREMPPWGADPHYGKFKDD